MASPHICSASPNVESAHDGDGHMAAAEWRRGHWPVAPVLARCRRSVAGLAAAAVLSNRVPGIKRCLLSAEYSARTWAVDAVGLWRHTKLWPSRLFRHCRLHLRCDRRQLKCNKLGSIDRHGGWDRLLRHCRRHLRLFRPLRPGAELDHTDPDFSFHVVAGDVFGPDCRLSMAHRHRTSWGLQWNDEHSIISNR